MSLINHRAKNHPQQVEARGPDHDTDDRRTPPEVFDPLAAEFAFTLDAAATAENALCRDYYSPTLSGLKYPWPGNVWCNPPYSDLGTWISKALHAVESGTANVVCMLLPANRCEQGWWQDYIEPRRDGRSLRGVTVETRFLRGRHRFGRPGWVKPKKGDRPPFGLVVCIFRMAA